MAEDKKVKSVKEEIDRSHIEARKVFMWGQVDDESAKDIIDRLLYLELKAPGKPIKFFINSPGGIVTSGMAIYDTIEAISSPVHTICMGLAASMGSILLSVGEKGHRSVTKYSRVMIHQPLGGTRGSASDIEIQARETLKVKEMGARILAENCGHSIEKIMQDFERDHWLNAEESVEYGIVDSILTQLP